jgi:hypothetical protein
MLEEDGDIRIAQDAAHSLSMRRTLPATLSVK